MIQTLTSKSVPTTFAIITQSMYSVSVVSASGLPTVNHERKFTMIFTVNHCDTGTRLMFAGLQTLGLGNTFHTKSHIWKKFEANGRID